ncbi:inosine-5 -monophosphate dehydrogenase [Thermoplasma volcanium GSS1]|uniref:Inosine-5-monophosphate dehydrogenase n=2 Tax=Thermoplasma volcanium TaxID=50339 RepID=Q97AJ9_THEVO|nr:inosine-5 -monophosphate dehydrogenase [Thermoplasma volcanium GSS1]
MTPDPVTVGVDDTFSKVMSKMNETGIHQLPVMDGNRYAGMITYSDLLKKRSIQVKSKISNYAINTPTLSADDDVLEAVRLIKDTGLSALPVFDKGKLVGIISRTDIIKRIDKISDISNLRAFQIMSPDPVAVSEDDSIEEAFDSLRQLNEVEIPVVDNEERLVGIVKLNDILGIMFREKEKIKYGGYGEKERVQIACGSVMDPPISVDRYADVKTVVDEMMKNELHIMPIVDSGKLVGIIDFSDLINIIKTESKEGILIEISGLDIYDEDLYDIAFDLSERFLTKFSKLTDVSQGKLLIHVMKYKTQGATKYSVRTRISAPPIFMVQNDAGWNFAVVLSNIFDRYEERLKKLKEK